MTNTNKILIGLLIGGVAAGGYYLYRRNKEGTYSDFPSPSQNEDPNTSSVTPQKSDPKNSGVYVAPQVSFQDKVKMLQAALRITADGVPGKQTMTTLNKFLSVPQLDQSNIDITTKRIKLLAEAVFSLYYNKDRSLNDKKLMWNLWRNKINSANLGLDFSRNVPPAFANYYGKGIYQFYNSAISGLNGTNNLALI
jgi:hypothetical protein